MNTAIVSDNTIDTTPEPRMLEAAFEEAFVEYGLSDSHYVDAKEMFFMGAKSLLLKTSDLHSFVGMAEEIRDYFEEDEDEVEDAHTIEIKDE